VDIRNALKALFLAVHIQYAVKTKVEGHVFAEMRDVPYRTASEAILRAAPGVSYRVEDGRFIIGPKGFQDAGPR